MFKIVKNRTAWRTVSFTIADEDGGGVSEASIDVKFVLLSSDDLAALPEKVADFVVAADAQTASMAQAFALDQIIADWRGPVGDDDKPLPYSVEALAVVINHVPSFLQAAREEFQLARAGEPQVRLGNLSELPGAGQSPAEATLQ